MVRGRGRAYGVVRGAAVGPPSSGAAPFTLVGPDQIAWFPSAVGVTVTFDLTGSGGTYDDVEVSGGGGAFSRHEVTANEDDMTYGFALQAAGPNDGAVGQTLISRWNPAFEESTEMISVEHGQPGAFGGAGGINLGGGNVLNYAGGDGAPGNLGGSPGSPAGVGQADAVSVTIPGGGGSAGVAAGASTITITES